MNWCRICRREASSSSLSNNFGPTPDISTHLCPEHLEQWNNSAELKRFQLKTAPACFVAFVDFVSRMIAEEAVIAEKLKRAEAEKKAADEKAAAEKNRITHALVDSGATS